MDATTYVRRTFRDHPDLLYAWWSRVTGVGVRRLRDIVQRSATPLPLEVTLISYAVEDPARAEAIASQPHPTREEFEHLHERLRGGVRDASLRLGLSDRQYRRILKGEAKLPPSARILYWHLSAQLRD